MQIGTIRLAAVGKVTFMDEWKSVLATNVRELRRARDLSQAQLARAAGQAQKTISRIERPEDDPAYSPRLEAVIAVAKALGVSVFHVLLQNLDASSDYTRKSGGLGLVAHVWAVTDDEGRAHIESVAKREALVAGARRGHGQQQNDHGKVTTRTDRRR